MPPCIEWRSGNAASPVAMLTLSRLHQPRRVRHSPDPPLRRSQLRCGRISGRDSGAKHPCILPCAPSTRMQVLGRNVRAADVSQMRILWRGGGRAVLAVRWNGLHPVRDRCCDARTSLKTVRPERSAEGAKSKGRESRKYAYFDFAELRSATLNTNGFDFETGSRTADPSIP